MGPRPVLTINNKNGQQNMHNSNQPEKTSWIDDNIPLSNRFDDTYYTKSDGRAETAHVFINGNKLSERWANLPDCTIGELGFGTGLNFLETVHQFNRHKLPGATLQFTSFELYPMTADDMVKALKRWPDLAELATKLCANWCRGGENFAMQFSDDIHLRVLFGDANDLLPNSNLTADAWYLDGFSPAKNPEMWNENLLKSVFNATRPGGTFATYSVAGFVRRNLQAAGFQIAREKGFGTKREMLTGIRSLTVD